VNKITETTVNYNFVQTGEEGVGMRASDFWSKLVFTAQQRKHDVMIKTKFFTEEYTNTKFSF